MLNILFCLSIFILLNNNKEESHLCMKSLHIQSHLIHDIISKPIFSFVNFTCIFILITMCFYHVKIVLTVWGGEVLVNAFYRYRN